MCRHSTRINVWNWIFSGFNLTDWPLTYFEGHVGSEIALECSKSLYDSLALFETPNHALQLINNTLLASLITQRSQVHPASATKTRQLGAKATLDLANSLRGIALVRELAAKWTHPKHSGRRLVNCMRNATWRLALRSVTRTFSITWLHYIYISDLGLHDGGLGSP
jgi:hypothetical protein